jgi:hypothetical protein
VPDAELRDGNNLSFLIAERTATFCPLSDNGGFWSAMVCPLSTRSGHAMWRLSQVNAAGRPYAAPVKAESPRLG